MKRGSFFIALRVMSDQRSVWHHTTYKNKHVLWRKRIDITKSVLFRDFTQLRIVTSYQRFGRNYETHLQNSRSQRGIAFICLNFEDGIEEFFLNCLATDRQVVPKRGHESTITGWVKFRKSADLIYTATEDRILKYRNVSLNDGDTSWEMRR